MTTFKYYENYNNKQDKSIKGACIHLMVVLKDGYIVRAIGTYSNGIETGILPEYVDYTINNYNLEIIKIVENREVTFDKYADNIHNIVGIYETSKGTKYHVSLNKNVFDKILFLTTISTNKKIRTRMVTYSQVYNFLNKRGLI